MSTTAKKPSIASQVREWVEAAAPGDILDSRTAPGAPSNATRVALSHLAADPYPDIVFVRRHIYWKHSFGEGAPAPIPTGPAWGPAALHIAGAGSGAAGFSAGSLFGWTRAGHLGRITEIAVVGRAPRGFEDALIVHTRANTERRRLNRDEVALLEAAIGFVQWGGYDIEFRSGHRWECDFETHDGAECFWDWSDALKAFAGRFLNGEHKPWSFDEQMLTSVAARERTGGKELRKKMADLADVISDRKRHACAAS